ncbi:uncharacterized protein C19orf85 homolog [Dromiciops gliroides]|uniref:uncharacterized protein C19orf85 homolog n=1 Tax=Dromiciops gliroides TaxID=33562 RepID=UPI001CC762DF|nr:uncharacterized protein C19orf85 homolog [Dromiciops gliroides]
MHPGTPATSGLPEPAPQELCAFVSGVAARILRTLQPRKARAPRRKPNHRRFLYNQLCRSFADIEEATRHLALTVLSQGGPGPQPKPRLQRPPSPFLGVAQALAAPENPGPGLALSPRALQSPTHDFLEIIPLSPGLQTLGPSLLPPVTEDPSMLAQMPPDPFEIPLMSPYHSSFPPTPASSLFMQAPHLPPMTFGPTDLSNNGVGIHYQDPGQCLPSRPMPLDTLSPHTLGVLEGTWPAGDPDCGDVMCWAAETGRSPTCRRPELGTL